MTPKKGTSAKTDPDLSALQAERDELKRQVLLKRECSERLKINKEIQELRKEYMHMALTFALNLGQETAIPYYRRLQKV